MQPPKQISAPRLSQFCGVHDATSLLIFKLKVIEKAAGQSNCPGRGRYKCESFWGWMSLDRNRSCPREYLNPWDGIRAVRQSLLTPPGDSVLPIARADLKNQKANEPREDLLAQNEGRWHSDKPGFWGLILEIFLWFCLKVSASEIQNFMLETVKHKGLYLGARDAVFMVSETQGTRGWSGQAGEQQGLARVAAAAWRNRQQLQLSSFLLTEIATGIICSTQGSDTKREGCF